MLQNRIRTLFKQINNITNVIVYNWESAKNAFIKLTEIIKIGDRILDPLNKLAISLYTYIFPRRRLNFLLMYYTHKIFDQIKNANKHKSYITANRKYIFSRYKTDSTYDQKIINCPEEIYQKIIYLNYENIAKLSLKN